MLSTSARVTFANRPDPPASLTVTSTKVPSITAMWTAPASSNGDLPSGYRLYIDDAVGGDFVAVFDGTSDQPATFSFVIEDNIECGALYNLKVTAVNTAGESDGTPNEIEVGDPPLSPTELRRTAITPLVSVTMQWDQTMDIGCLPIRKHVVSRDGVDLVDLIAPELDSFTDDISAFAMGALITYRVKSVNDAPGDGAFSEPLIIQVGQPPDAPTNIVIS